MHDTLYTASMRVILENQHPGGGFVASPTYPAYQYVWLRDGSYIAHALGLVGETEAAARYHRWVGRVVERQTPKILSLLERIARGETIPQGEQLHTRFTVLGEEGVEDWGNFQLDGWGTWLWAATKHLQQSGDRALYTELSPHFTLIARYLAASWQVPCYDCWEERGDQVHTATLAAVFGGLSTLTQYDTTQEGLSAAQDIQQFVLEHCTANGYFTRSPGDHTIDASLVGICTPYNLVPEEHEVMCSTIAHITSDLGAPDTHRYPHDSYYGGGAWPLLSAWLGWHHALAGNIGLALKHLHWVAAQADDSLLLPEQVAEHLRTPEQLAPWNEQHGPSAHPLLWSHAMYLILAHALDTK